MISTLVRNKIRMLKNRVASATSMEFCAGGIVCILLLSMIWLISDFIFQDIEFLRSFLEKIGIKGLGGISIFLIHLIFFPILAACINEEAELLQSGETIFISGFPHPQHKFYLYKLIFAALRVIPSISLLTPLLFVYSFFFYQFFGVKTLFAFYLVLPLVIFMITNFLSSLVLLLVTVKAKLMTLLKTQTLIIFSILVYGVFAVSLFFPLLFKGPQEIIFMPIIRMIMNEDGVISTLLRWSSVSQAVRILEVFSDGNWVFLFQHALSGAIGILLVNVLSFAALKLFFLNDPGLLLENIQLKQTATLSTGYGFLLKKFPSILRGIIYDDVIHFKRLFVIYFFLTFASVGLIPLYFPNSLMALISSQLNVFCCINLAFLIIFAMEFLLLDLAKKEAFLPLLRLLPVNLTKFLAIKCLGNAILLFILQAVCLLLWRHFWGISTSNIVLLFSAAFFWSVTTPFLANGIGALVLALSSEKRGSSENKPLFLMFFIGVGVLGMIGSTVFPIKAGLLGYLPWVYLAWIIIASIVFYEGAKMLEEKDLDN